MGRQFQGREPRPQPASSRKWKGGGKREIFFTILATALPIRRLTVSYKIFSLRALALRACAASPGCNGLKCALSRSHRLDIGMKQNVTMALPTVLNASFGRTPSAVTSSRRSTGLRPLDGATVMEVGDLREKGEQVVPQERIRIAFVIEVIGAWNLGGTEKQLAHLASTLDQRIFEPVIFVLKPTPAAEATDLACPVISVTDSESQSRTALFLKLRSALKDFCPHILQTFFIAGTFYGTLAAWLNAVPAIVQSRRNAAHWQKAHHTLALRAINHLVDSWHRISPFVADRIRRMQQSPPWRLAG